MNFPLIPISSVIADVKSELKRMNQAGEILDDDCINLAIECIREIGGHHYKEAEVPALVEIKRNVGILPKHIYLIKRIWVVEHNQKFRATQISGTGLFMIDGSPYYKNRVIYPADAITASTFCTDHTVEQNIDVPAYIIKKNQIRCGISNCLLAIEHISFPIQNNEFEMQDEIFSIKTVKAFIKKSLLEEKWINGEVPHYVYMELKNEYLSNFDQAHAVMKAMDYDETEKMADEQDQRYDDFKLS